MPFFVVISDKPSPELGGKIAELYPESHLEINSSQWILVADKVTTELAKELGIPDGKLGKAIVFKVETWWGWHNKAIWEWLELKSKK